MATRRMLHQLPLNSKILGHFLEAGPLPGHGLADCQHRIATALAKLFGGGMSLGRVASRAGWGKRQQGCRTPRCFAPSRAVGSLDCGRRPAAFWRQPCCRMRAWHSPIPSRFRVGRADWFDASLLDIAPAGLAGKSGSRAAAVQGADALTSSRRLLFDSRQVGE